MNRAIIVGACLMICGCGTSSGVALPVQRLDGDWTINFGGTAGQGDCLSFTTGHVTALLVGCSTPVMLVAAPAGSVSGANASFSWTMREASGSSTSDTRVEASGAFRTNTMISGDVTMTNVKTGDQKKMAFTMHRG